MSILTVDKLNKKYPGFALQDISFSLTEGAITGFIGRNGAGKTTTLKSLLNFVHPDSGRIAFFGQDFADHELAIKEQIGFVSGGIDFYPRQKIAVITQATKQFYPHWDEAAYQHYLELFALDERKTPAELSAGMKVKYALALALSHRAKLLILDEPTSGLDPISREELLDIFLHLVSEQKLTIFFSTHITADLEKCADYIIYIRQGRIYAREQLDSFKNSYRLIQFSEDVLPQLPPDKLLGCKKSKTGYQALVPITALPLSGVQATTADLDSIMVHLEKEGEHDDKITG